MNNDSRTARYLRDVQKNSVYSMRERENSSQIKAAWRSIFQADVMYVNTVMQDLCIASCYHAPNPDGDKFICGKQAMYLYILSKRSEVL